MKFENPQSSRGLSNSPRIGHITHTNRHSSKTRYFVRDLERDCWTDE